MKHCASISSLGAISCAVLFFCGCTVIGYMVGDAVDRSLPPKVIVPGWEVAKLIAGDSLEIIATDGTIIPAVYGGMDSTAIVLQSDSNRRLFPLDSILQVQIPYHGKGKTIGLLLGLAADGAAYYAITSWHKAYHKGHDEGYEAGYGPPPAGGSCPHVYSHDGHGYVIDSEPYAGAMVEALQRTDIDNLDYLRERRGQCKLLVSNGVEETEHVDAVSLLMVEHPHGVRVVPSFDGSLHTVRQAMPPVAAFDERGADILPLLTATDERIWSSNPFGRNPAEMSQVRDGIELHFARPAGAQTAKLLVNVQNTVWAGSMLKRLLQLHGRELPSFYDQLNASEFMRNLLGNALIREGALLIKIWNGLEWTDGGYIFDVGSRVAKDQIVLLNLEHVVGDTLRLRFESTAGFWKMNSAAVDYSADLPVTTVEVFPEKALTEQGRNVVDALRTIDHRCYEMPDPENRAELVFRVPPRAARLDRSYLLKCTGYYTIHVAAEGDPQTELIFSLALVPGAFGQYALQTLNEQTMLALSSALPK